MLVGYILGVEIHSTLACATIQQPMLFTSILKDLIYTECYRSELSSKKDEELPRATTKSGNPDR